ncbi:uncharacterized protein DNG_04579 [Cephalotrichum gorgonifer]|uniref:Uncharacterized protein n=1 Tax=Cephalotrichum gorgonifer TaxID=2041049 RepID=A0AAE8SUP5_9PEZI|nr:uncharacterized protein DNG_04579 [Cephalotrichum gorgonifer]
MVSRPAGVSFLESLPLHLLEEICEHLAADGGGDRSLLALYSTSTWLCSAAARSRFKTIHIKFKAESLKGDVERWRGILQTRDCARYVRRLDITAYRAHKPVASLWPLRSDLGFWRSHVSFNYYAHGHPLTDEDRARQSETWQPLVDFVPSLTGLKDVIFADHEPIPATLFAALQNHPQDVRLHLDSFTLRSLDHVASRLQDIDAFDKALVSSPCLSSICVQDARWAREPFDIDVTNNDNAVWRMVVESAPKLKSVVVDFIRIAPRSHFSPNAPLGDTVRRKAALEVLYLRYHGLLNPSFILEWNSSVDFSSLRTLYLELSAMAPSALGTLCEIAGAQGFQSLRDLSLMVGPMIVSANGDEMRVDPDLACLFSALRPLESLELRGQFGEVAFGAILRSHGQSLRALRLLPVRFPDMQLDPFVLTLDRIRALTRACPDLRDLELLVQRSKGNEEEVQTYRAIGELRRLDRLSLQLDSSILHPVSGVGVDSDDTTIDAMTETVLRDAFINAAIDADLATGIFECICRQRSPGYIRLVAAELVAVGNDCDYQEAKARDSTGTVQNHPLRRRRGRALVAILIPATAVKYRTFSGSLIFYSWFLIGVFYLSWAKHVLIGVEASMLRSPFWRGPNLVALIEHSNKTWSSPAGWINAVLAVPPKRLSDTWGRDIGPIKLIEPRRLWTLLAVLSFLPFVAVPLSGLVFENTDGYIKTSDVPLMEGRNQTTFNMKYELYSTPAQDAWLVGSTPSMPGFGVIYTNKSVDRSKHMDFEKVPNTLPLTESIPDLFLVPQADKPVSGKTWGLRIKYDCSIVTSTSQFTILSQKSVSEITLVDCRFVGPSDSRCINLKTPSGSSIDLWNTTTLSGKYNVEAYLEIGTSHVEEERYRGDYPDFEMDEGAGSVVFEYAAWQYHTNGIVDKPDSPLPFNTTIGVSIEGLGAPVIKSDNGTYTMNNTFFDIKAAEVREFMRWNMIGNHPKAGLLAVAPPIGVRASSTSTTYRVAYQVSSPFSNGNRYEQFIDSKSLLRSVNLAHAWDAFDLMYGVTSGFKRKWPEPGLTSSREGKILAVASLIPGAAMGYVVFTLFCIWALALAGLGLVYGFRKKPGDAFDDYMMLRKGADMVDELKDNEDFMSGKPFRGSRTLTELRSG